MVFSIMYPILKATITFFNTQAKLLELKSEVKIKQYQQNVYLMQKDIETITKLIENNYNNIGSSELKKILLSLPRFKDLEFTAEERKEVEIASNMEKKNIEILK